MFEFISIIIVILGFITLLGIEAILRKQLQQSKNIENALNELIEVVKQQNKG